jgi:hypothetical protein
MKRSKWLICCVAFLVLFSTGFGMASKASSSVVTSSDTQKILITGYSSKDLEVSVGEIKKLPQVKKEVVSVNSNGEKKTFTVIGGDFDALLKKLNISKDSIGGLRFICTDGYSVEVPEAIVKSRQIVLSYLKNGEDLGEDGPILAVIPEERAMYWAKMLSKIEIIKKTKKIEVACVNFVEAIGKSKIINTYKDLSGKHQAIKCSDLIKLINAKNKPDYVILKAADGLEKNETLVNFNNAYIKLTGKKTPEFTSLTMPDGMKVSNLLYFTYGETGNFIMTKGIGTLDLTSIGANQGISLNDIFKTVGMKNVASYTMIARNGQKVAISGDNVKKAVVYKNKQQQVVIEIPSGVKNTKLVDVISVKVK